MVDTAAACAKWLIYKDLLLMISVTQMQAHALQEAQVPHLDGSHEGSPDQVDLRQQLGSLRG